MKIKKGDYVTRKSYDNDTVFIVLNISSDTYFLKGVDVRLYADSNKEDLVKVNKPKENDDFVKKFKEDFLMDRSDFFYLPPKILHIDGDEMYLKRCLNFYKEAGILAIGKYLKEEDMAKNIRSLLIEYNPDIVIISGHDAYYRKRKDRNKYKNSTNFINSVKEARKYEKSHEKLIIIAGACQSDYEELIKAASCIYQLSDLRCCPEVLVGCNRGNHCVSDPDSLGYFQQKTGAYPKDLYTDFCYTGIAGAD